MHATERAIDLRSDTVTRPTPAMRKAMAEAEVGDDHYGEDPTVNRLEALAAALLGFEAAVFVPSGTMANAMAIRVLTAPGDEVLAEARAHVVNYEMSGMATLSGVIARTVSTDDGLLTAEAIRRAVRPRALYRADVRLLVLENTQNLAGGVVQDVASTRAAIAEARAQGMNVHLDGARLWNAAVALGVPPRELAAGVDTVMVDLSKGLCAPVGALLASSSELVQQGAPRQEAARGRPAPVGDPRGSRDRGPRVHDGAARRGSRQRAPSRRSPGAGRRDQGEARGHQHSDRPVRGAAGPPRRWRPSPAVACGPPPWTPAPCAS